MRHKVGLVICGFCWKHFAGKLFASDCQRWAVRARRLLERHMT